MVTFHVDEFEAAQAHEPQVGRWTIGDTIYVLEQEGDEAQLPTAKGD